MVSKSNTNFRIKMRNPRPCNRCGEKFIPTGKFCKLCDKCWNLAITKGIKSCKATMKRRKAREKFIFCPFRSKTTNKCSHKKGSTCTFPNHPYKCEWYKVWLDGLKDDFYSVESLLQANYKRSDNE